MAAVSTHALSLRSLLDAGPVVGTFLKIPRFEVVDLLAIAGFDFVVCDYEHAQMTIGDATDIVRAGVGRGLPVVVRVPSLDRGEINRLLEAGAAGIQLARGSADASAGLRTLVSYPPLGSRSVSLGQPAANYGIGVTLAEHFERSNRETLAVGQFETADYADGIDEAMAALDVAFIGPVDLSVDLGTPGDLNSAPMQEATAAIEAAAAKAGKPMGVFTGTADAATAARAKGYRYIVTGSDLSMLSAGARAHVG
ncbi:aldolase/citrate lyase family protein [Agrococcus sp. ARC_14]|uniref:HpcH/HpaI aldolase family protein n=1 Tax=Agrococcus sp. ARC_14 TaxID=2919927 RepID=UPI001F06E0A6|nr:aldolase/citrate lyase family protein [Agrococcus sp. ARC_14]MCH1883972.1 aldolase/citrate lyase family protein [Agrococcus sp. ARC_14]